MAKKLLFATVLLLLVSVQALTASCDVRCALMGASTDRHHHALQTEQMADCQGMSMESSGQGASLTAGDSCPSTPCGTELTAITKSGDRNDFGASKLLVSSVALLVDAFGSSEPNRTIVFASLNRKGDSRPLAQRPGSSLRI
jgi:hypothetical protein